MNNLFSSRTRLTLRIGGALLLALILLLTATVPSMATGRHITISYFYNFIQSEPALTTVQPGQTFTIYNELGGCGPVYRDVAQVQVDSTGRIRAYYHDCLTGDGVGTFGPWVRNGCSSAHEIDFVVTACVIHIEDDQGEDN